MSICVDNDLCLAVGKHRANILSYFNFKSFKYAKTLHRMNQDMGGSGIIHGITYKRGRAEACAILKTSQNAHSDNLFYEYLCGLFINKLNLKYRCFIETYGLFRYSSTAAYERFQRVQSTVPISQLDMAVLAPLTVADLRQACTAPTNICILIQCVKDTVSLYDKMSSPEFVRDHLISVLYQIYYPLAKLAAHFTHYDLHLDNILVADTPPSTYRYGKSFTCPYIAKMIDYGRCYFKDAANSSEMFHHQLCDTCAQCGTDAGFDWFSENEFYVFSSKVNQSHDLFALSRLRSTFGDMIEKYNPPLYALLQKVTYISDKGTPQNILNDGQINSVGDASVELEKLIRASSMSASSPASISRASSRSSSRRSMRRSKRL